MPWRVNRRRLLPVAARRLLALGRLGELILTGP
jgi:hypothetical protein